MCAYKTKKNELFEYILHGASKNENQKEIFNATNVIYSLLHVPIWEYIPLSEEILCMNAAVECDLNVKQYVVKVACF